MQPGEQPPLLIELQSREIELHQPEARGNARRLDELLHDDFCEFGRSGKAYTKADMIHALQSATQHPSIVADRFLAQSLSADIVLLTYRSAQRLANGDLHHPALRSSLWQHSPGQGWQMRFHQGTPAEPFDMD